ncbi:MAG: hypothetical protein IPI73_24055 [Betaproteobacteria bacterium]|nr:hypothetical protein [Betaproteobacteria bacterium]
MGLSTGVTGAAIAADGTIYLPCGLAGLLKIVYNPPAAPVELLISQISGFQLSSNDAAFDSNGILWLAGGKRLLRVDLAANTATEYPLSAAQGYAARVLIGPDNHVWYLSNGAVLFGRLNPVTTEITVLQSPSALISPISRSLRTAMSGTVLYDYAIGEVLPDNSIQEWLDPNTTACSSSTATAP